MLAWRLISRKMYGGCELSEKNETQFTTNPVLFCEMFKTVLKEFESEKEIIYNWDDLMAFDTTELTSYYDHEGTEEIFILDYRYYDDNCSYVYEIETVDILI